MILTMICKICVLVAAVLDFCLILRYNLHMFQLNGYKNKEHLPWLMKNAGKQRLLWVLLGAAILFALLTLILQKEMAGYILLFLTFLPILWYYNYLRRQKAKKKLNYTARVKRLMVTNVLVIALLTVVAVLLGGEAAGCLILSLCLAAEPLIIMLSNRINQPVEKAVNQYYIRDAQKMLRSNKNLTIIGITGSYGKTSMKYFLGAILQEKYNTLITPESYNTPMGIVKTIRGSLKPSHEIFVCEMGARHVGDIKEICDIVHPHHGILTSIGPQHLETFFTIDNIVNTKFELADALPADGLLFLNGDNDLVRERGQRYKAIYFGTEGKTEGYKAQDIQYSELGTSFKVVTPSGESEMFQTRLIGSHNLIDLLGAIAAAHTLGVPLTDMKVAIRRIQPVAHRLQLIERGNVTIIDDAFNSNPVGSKAAVETLAMFGGERILVTPGMVELGKEEERYNFEFGTYAADCCDVIILVGKKRTRPIAEGVKSRNFPEDKLIVTDTLEEALAAAYSIPTEEHRYILLENDLPDNY
ncbi:MAG: UDP-N-acetylmuramoyl-tripeptide--D-alanyl-D-alanine ligase [Lachnospiraceae bacterium]|nr:UDP-N-acetylmuramoyl-tripeptide--D-alanyl-D-alanine ligase [Lachnospiraceae bacterium]